MSRTGPAPGAEDEVLGRAYDRRLMGRLWKFVRPYRGVVALSAVSFPLLAAVDLVQPYLTKVAIDAHILRGDWAGLSRIALLFLLTLVLQFGLRYAQAFLLAWTGQQVVRPGIPWHSGRSCRPSRTTW